MPRTSSPPSSPRVVHIPSWVEAIGDSLDHYHGSTWDARVLPNNYIFYVHNDLRQFTPASVTHSIHHRYELVVALAGHGHVCVEETFYPFAPGQALLVKPGEFHRYFSISDPLTWLFFGFDLGEGTGLILEENPVRDLLPGDLALLSKAGKLQIAPVAGECSSFTVALHMGNLLRSMKERPIVKPLENIETEEFNATIQLRQIARFVDKELEKRVRITGIADHLGVSESNLRKLFRERFGVSLGSYLQRSRLSRSLQLIGSPTLSVSEIAQQCGFESIFSFSQAFSNAIGMSPSAYRRHLTEGGSPVSILTKTATEEIPTE